MNNPTVLIVDDDPDIIELITVYLEAEHFGVLSANNGQQAYHLFNSESVDIILLDVMMPEMNGFQFIKELRKMSTTPVIFLTAKIEVADKILGLQLGADDYIEKPFNPLELIARIHANLRRTNHINADPDVKDKDIIPYGSIELDLIECVLYKDNDRIPLTSTEFRVLKLFMESPGRVFTKQQIWEAGWDQGLIVEDNSIMVCISKIRSKLGSDQPYITTIRGLGYRLEKLNEN
ncbi:response regulator transcription factor [Paenibacillus sp. YSY-4.3]